MTFSVALNLCTWLVLLVVLWLLVRDIRESKRTNRLLQQNIEMLRRFNGDLKTGLAARPEHGLASVIREDPNGL